MQSFSVLYLCAKSYLELDTQTETWTSTAQGCPGVGGGSSGTLQMLQCESTVDQCTGSNQQINFEHAAGPSEMLGSVAATC